MPRYHQNHFWGIQPLRSNCPTTSSWTGSRFLRRQLRLIVLSTNEFEGFAKYRSGWTKRERGRSKGLTRWHRWAEKDRSQHQTGKPSSKHPIIVLVLLIFFPRTPRENLVSPRRRPPRSMYVATLRLEPLATLFEQTKHTDLHLDISKILRLPGQRLRHLERSIHDPKIRSSPVCSRSIGNRVSS